VRNIDIKKEYWKEDFNRVHIKYLFLWGWRSTKKERRRRRKEAHQFTGKQLEREWSDRTNFSRVETQNKTANYFLGRLLQIDENVKQAHTFPLRSEKNAAANDKIWAGCFPPKSCFNTNKFVDAKEKCFSIRNIKKLFRGSFKWVSVSPTLWDRFLHWKLSLRYRIGYGHDNSGTVPRSRVRAVPIFLAVLRYGRSGAP